MYVDTHIRTCTCTGWLYINMYMIDRCRPSPRMTQTLERAQNLWIRSHVIVNPLVLNINLKLVNVKVLAF